MAGSRAMTKSELEAYGFKIEILPSTRINLYNKAQFKINDLLAYFCIKGEYQFTTSHTSINSLLKSIRKLEFV